MTDPIKPALTPEEWTKFGCIRKPNVIMARDGPRVRNGHGCIVVAEVIEDSELCEVCGSSGDEDAMVVPEARHALAALALYGQPFGFTWEDVDRIAKCAEYIDDNYVDEGMESEPLRSVIDRIAALLPPREEQ